MSRRSVQRATLAAIHGILAAALGGCVFEHGHDESAQRSVRSAWGEMFKFQIAMEPGPNPRIDTVLGEILESHPDAVLLQTDDGILHVALSRVLVPEGRPPAWYRLRARYPYGLAEERLHQLLETTEQNRVDTLPPFDEPASGAAALGAFLDAARRTAGHYREVEAAIAAGYRQLGPSFPGMGEHWIQPGLIVEEEVDPARPPVLCYAQVDGRRRLLGVAYAVPLEPDETPPAYPAGPQAWHDHSDQVDEELLLLSHPDSHHGGDGPRLAMLHAWLELPNPDGVLAQNNWRLPFLQAGLDPLAVEPTVDAGRALSLHTSGPDYYLNLFRIAARERPLDERRVGEVLQEAGAEAAAWAAGARTRATDPSASDLADLERIWHDLWRRLQDVTTPETFRALAPLS